MSQVVIDDHLLRDVLAGEQGRRLARLVDTNELATTNLYYVRLCKSVIAARGGKLTGGWAADRRRELGRRLLDLPASILILPMRLIGYRTAELAEGQRVSTLGAEAVAAGVRGHFGVELKPVTDERDVNGRRRAILTRRGQSPGREPVGRPQRSHGHRGRGSGQATDSGWAQPSWG